jgi:hypothetical protein
MNPIGVRHGRKGHSGRSGDDTGSQSVSAGIYFVNSNDDQKDSNIYYHVNIDAYIHAHPGDDGTMTRPELPVSPVDQGELGLSPVNTRSESNPGDALASGDFDGVYTQTSAASPPASGGDPDNGSKRGHGAPVYISKTISTSAATSAASIGVRASIGIAAVGRGSNDV